MEKYKLKKVATVGFIITKIAALSLTGCQNVGHTYEDTEYIYEYENDVPAAENRMISQEANEGDVVPFGPGKQVVRVRTIYDSCETTPDVGGFRCPEGYTFYGVIPVTNDTEYGSETIGYDTFFINNREVEVTAAFDEYHGTYTFNTFGVPTEYENVKVR